MEESSKASIAVIGAGWWSQGWHLPQLSNNASVEIEAIVEPSEHPRSTLNPNLETRARLAEHYNCPIFYSTEKMLQVPSLADRIDGAIICTSHSSHFEIGKLLLREDDRRRKAGGKPLHIMMEKPMTTNVHEAKDLHELVISRQPIDRIGCFLLNHSANYREQTKVAQAIVKDGKLGTIRHVTASFAAPLSWLFDDPANKGWNEPDSTGTMLGNGFAWGQSSHILAWIFHVGCGQIQPRKVFCIMSHSERTGADVAHTASIQCDGEVTFALSGTSLLPGCQYSTSPVGKEVHIEMFGSKGALMYHGNDLDPSSGRLEFRLGGNDKDAGKAEVLCANLGFLFENAAQGGQGPESLQNFVTACFSKKMYAGADSKIGLMTVQAIEAMYRSQSSGKVEVVVD